MTVAYKNEVDPPPVVRVRMNITSPDSPNQYYRVEWATDEGLFNNPAAQTADNFWPLMSGGNIALSSEFLEHLDAAAWQRFTGNKANRYLYWRIGKGSNPDPAVWQWSAIGAYQINHMPQADAGLAQDADLTALRQVTREIILDGSRSSDPDSSPLTYRWTVRSAPGVCGNNLQANLAQDSARVVFLPLGTQIPQGCDGSYQIQLEIQDDDPPSISRGTLGRATAHTSVTLRELSGAQWVDRFPGSRETDALTATFRPRVDRFIAALEAEGAVVRRSSTFRPSKRSYLMHYAGRIANNSLLPQNVPPFDPSVVPPMDPFTGELFIQWVHRDANGNIDLNASRAAAQAMMVAYDIAFPAAFPSRHARRTAIDMSITWAGNLNITDGQGRPVIIDTLPRNGAGNAQLHAVGASYGVIKLVVDPPHWSEDGH